MALQNELNHYKMVTYLSHAPMGHPWDKLGTAGHYLIDLFIW